MKRRAWTIPAAALLLAASCAEPSRPPRRSAAAEPPPVQEPPPPTWEIVARDTILYRVQTGRAEDYVDTLRQFFGPDVILVPQRDTNTILIRIPPRLPGAPQPVGPPPARSPPVPRRR